MRSQIIPHSEGVVWIMRISTSEDATIQLEREGAASSHQWHWAHAVHEVAQPKIQERIQREHKTARKENTTKETTGIMNAMTE